MKRIKICNFTEPELDVFRQLCNFTDDERTYFELRAKDESNVYIARQLHVSESKVDDLARKVRSKILRIIARL